MIGVYHLAKASVGPGAAPSFPGPSGPSSTPCRVRLCDQHNVQGSTRKSFQPKPVRLLASLHKRLPKVAPQGPRPKSFVAPSYRPPRPTTYFTHIFPLPSLIPQSNQSDLGVKPSVPLLPPFPFPFWLYRGTASYQPFMPSCRPYLNSVPPNPIYLCFTLQPTIGISPMDPFPS